MNEWIIVGVVALVVIFGVSKLPEIGKGIGEGIKNFKKALSGQSEIDVTPKKKAEDTEELREKKA